MDIRHLWGENLVSSQKGVGKRRVDLESALSWQEALGPGPQEGFGSEAGFFEFSWPRLRGACLFLTLLSLFLTLYAKNFRFQVVEGAYNRSLSEGNRLRGQIIRAPRGIITDREGQPLVGNIPGFQVVWDPSFQSLALREEMQGTAGGEGLEQPEEGGELDPVWQRLAGVLDIPLEILRGKLEEAEEGLPVILKADVSRDQVLAVETQFFHPQLRTEVSPVRFYPYGEVLAHIVGFTGMASASDLSSANGVLERGARVGRGGLEQEFDLLLRGRSGERLLEVDASGRAITELAKREAEVGQDLRTTLDLGLQERSFAALRAGVEKSKATGGAVVAENPRTGEILALLSFPSFDPNQFVSGLSRAEFEAITNHPQKPLFNRSLLGAYPPGSVFKLITAIAALSEGVIDPARRLNCLGMIAVGSFTFRDWKPEGHGEMSLVEAIAESCDVYFYTVGGGYGGQKGVGPEKIAHWARLFGLGELLDIEQPWEGTGLVPDPEWKERVRKEPWFLGNTYHFAIGQGDLLATPLQITNAVSAIANGGTLHRPTLVLGSEPKVLREGFVSTETLFWVREGMRAACSPGGTAYPFFNFPVSVAGKTGTSETGREDATHAWFTVFAPFDDPEIVLTVLLENGGEGSHDAAPVAKEILDWYFSHRGHPE